MLPEKIKEIIDSKNLDNDVEVFEETILESCLSDIQQAIEAICNGTTTMIGGMPSGVKRVAPWIKKWTELYPLLKPARCTLCFNWLDPNATTSRYPEALSICLIPFVWQDYDENDTYNIDPWQRVSSFEDLKHKMLQLRDDSFLESTLTKYRSNYK